MLNSARFKALHGGLTGVAQKVYKAVPISEAWTAPQISGEISRLGGNTALNIVGGCLCNLIQSGLVLERGKGLFIRAPVKEAVPRDDIDEASEGIKAATEVKIEVKKDVAMSTAPKPQPAPVDVIDRLTALSARARSGAELMKKLAADIDTAAIEIEGQMSSNTGEMAKLKQLQILLKSL